MKLKLKHIFIGFIIVFCLSEGLSQNTRDFTPIILNNYTPLWMHTSVDSSMAGVQEPPYIYDGYQHFSGAFQPLINSNFAFIVYERNLVSSEGAFIEKLNLKNGKAIKTQFWDLRNNDEREFPSSAFINDNDELEILGFRKNDTLSTWYNALFGSVTLDTSDLSILDHDYGMPDDSLSKKLKYPLGGSLAVQLMHYNDDQYYYFSKKTHNYSFEYHLLDNQGLVLGHNNYYRPLPFSPIDWYYNTSDMYVVDDQKFMNMTYCINEKRDSNYVNLEYFDKEMNSIVQFNITEDIIVEDVLFINQVTENTIIFDGVEFLDERGIKQKYTSYVYDHQGNLLEKVRLVDKEGFDFRLFVVSSLADENGILVMVMNHLDQTFHIHRSDGKGNLREVQDFSFSPQDHVLAPKRLTQLDNGDILLYARHGYYEFTPAPRFRGNWSTWIRFDAKDLDISTSSKDWWIKEKINMELYPNPGAERTTLTFGENLSGSIEIKDYLGRIVGSFDVIDQSEVVIQTDLLVNGVYYFHFNNIGKQSRFKPVKFVKI